MASARKAHRAALKVIADVIATAERNGDRELARALLGIVMREARSRSDLDQVAQRSRARLRAGRQ
jgi:hypothetical protein